VFIAALPARLIEKGLPGVGLLVHLLLSRFEDHLPFYRLEKIFRERHGVPISRQSMVDWTEQLATWLQPIYRAMKTESFAEGYHRSWIWNNMGSSIWLGITVSIV
jgi:transposase